MKKKEILRFIKSVGPKDWYYYYNFDGIEVRPELKRKKSHNLKNWKVIYKVLSPLMSEFDDPRILDIGCNMGLYAYELCRLGAKVTGVDRKVSQAEFFQRYIRENEKQKFDAKFVAMDVTKQDISSYDCDIITMFCVIYHLEPHANDILKRLPTHKYLVLQGNLGRIRSKKRKNQKLAGVQGMKNLLKKVGYEVISYPFDGYEKPLVVGKKI